MRPATLFALAVTPLLVGAGVRSPAGTAVRPAGSLVVTPAWLAQHQDDPDLVILEISEEAEYRQGHIRRSRPVDPMTFHHHGTEFPPAAHFVPAVQALGISNSSRIVLVGEPIYAAMTWMVFEYLGMGDRTLVLQGGKRGWTEAGNALTSETPAYLGGTFVPQPRPDIIIGAALLAVQLRSPRLALIDGRSRGEFDGAEGGEVASPGHIPGAVNLDWERTFDASGTLLPADSLRAMLAQAGYAPGDQLVFYCTVGMRASHLYFVARHLGLTPQIYLGSIADWTSDPSRPVVRAEGP
jgi:thiosulfate/3-mercaptopyruvate sulfurtransferase